MKIECLCDFKDGRDEFLQTEVRRVDADRAEYFAKNGWAKILDEDAPEVVVEEAAAVTDLEIDSVTVGHKSNTKG